MAFSTLLGLAMLSGSFAMFILAMPWGGKVRFERIQSPLMMLLIGLFFVGAAFALMGFPEPIKLSERR